MKRIFLVVSILLAFAEYGRSQIISFTVSQPNGLCAPSTVVFTNTSGNIPQITYIKWDWGDGTPPAEDTSFRYGAEHPYTSPGTYTVTLTVQWTGSPGTSTQTITIYGNPSFTFSANRDTICPDDTVTFSVNLSYPSNPSDVKSYLWEFGDGGQSTSPNPKYVYRNARNEDLIAYDVSLFIEDNHGCSELEGVQSLIHVRRKPVVNFATDLNAVPSIYCVDPTDPTATVTFTNRTDDTLTPPLTSANTYLWNFGDGGSSTDQDPTHIYQTGVSTVTLTATSPDGCVNSRTMLNIINVMDYRVTFTTWDTIMCKIPAEFSVSGSNGSDRYNINFGNNQSCNVRTCTTIYTSPGTYQVRITGTHNSGNCSATETITVHVFDASLEEMSNVITDTNMCDLSVPVVFENKTTFQYPDDFGFEKIEWFFGDTSSAGMGSNYDSGSIVQHLYGTLGEYIAKQVVTTPYGCPLDTLRQPMHVFPLYTVGGRLEPAPPAPPSGCVPLAVGVFSHPDSLRTTSPITDYIWRWDYNGVINKDDTLNTDTIFIAEHTYQDTGSFDVYVTLINEQGCRYDVFIVKFSVGAEPVSGFTYKFIEGCKNEVGLQVFAYDSLQADTLIVINPYGASRANDWQWLDPQNPMAPIGNGDTTSVSFSTAPGYQGVILVPLHNGCAGPQLMKDSVAYVCPPFAAIEYPKDNPDGSPPVFCEYTDIDFINGSQGGMKYEWYMGDTVYGTHGLAGQTLYVTYDFYDSITGDPLPGYPEPDPSHIYTPTDDERRDPNYYLFKNEGLVIITLIAYNWDSTSNEYLPDGSPHPTYNRCKYCDDRTEQLMLISDAIMNFTTDKIGVCQGDSVHFFDSTLCTIGIMSWGFKFLSAVSSPSEYPTNGDYIDFKTFPPPRPEDGFKLPFTRPNKYTLVLQDTCFFKCVRYDTIELEVWPRSVPNFLTSKTPNIPSSFNTRPDTLCLNTPDTLYFKDNSYSPDFYNEPIDIVDWTWTIRGARMTDLSGKDTLRGKEPAGIPITSGTGFVNLTVTNDRGCDSSLLIANDSRGILINYVDAKFSTREKRYCHKTTIAFTNQSLAYPTATHNGTTTLFCEWDWGDGTRSTQTFVSDLTTQPIMGHAYNISETEKTMIVTLKVRIEGSDCEEVFIDSITIIRPIADFTDDGHIFPCPGRTGRMISFSDQSEGGVSYYAWNFGDSANKWNEGKDMTNPLHIYTTAGSYTVTLIVEDSIMGCRDTMRKENYVFIDGPAGTVSYAPLSGCVTLAGVKFTPTIVLDPKTPSGFTVDSIIYNPDGATTYSNSGYQVQNPYTFNKGYTTAGIYYPYFQLIKWVDNPATGEKERCVVEWAGEDPIWAIDLTPDFIVDDLYCLDAIVDIRNTTKVEPADLFADSIHWDYGNNNSLWMYYPDTEYPDGSTTYDTEGTYKITLTEYYKLCTKSISYDIEVMPFPNLFFSPDTSAACDGLEVEFNAYPIDGIVADRISKYEWRFDDGVTIEGNPASREFSESNLYNYDVEVTFTPKNCAKTWEDSIVIFAYRPPKAEFSADPTVVETGGTVNFTDESTKEDGDLVTWDWDFGDGSNKNSEQNPSHAYSSTSGILTVTLNIIDEYGCKSSIQHQVTVMERLRFPNVFTPVGSDGQKYVFKPIEDKGYFKQFRVEVYNKWGALVWNQSCTDPNCPDYQNDGFWWDGRNKQGKMVADGVYFWVVYAEPLTETGNIILNGSLTIFNGK